LYARHQGHAADARRKAKVVLDPRRSTRLAAERTAVEDQSGEPFRAGIHRSGKARRACSNDSYVIDAIGIDRPYQADTAGEFVFARIAQQLSVRAQNDRQLTGVDKEAFDQRFRLRVGLRIQCLMGMAIAAEKVFEPKYIAALGTVLWFIGFFYQSSPGGSK